jgi:hypothetical protein
MKRNRRILGVSSFRINSPSQGFRIDFQYATA